MRPKSTMSRQQFVRLCECGCGQPTLLAPRTDAAQGWRKGEPQRFLPLHRRKLGPRETKICARCKQAKPVAEFAAHGKHLQAYCRECSAEHQREWRQANREHWNAYQREQYAAHLEFKRAEARASYRRQRQKPERVERMRVQKLDAIHRRDAKMGEPDAETLAYIEQLRQEPCSYCGRTPAGTVDHIVPLDAGGAHHWSNLAAACETCNKSKRTKPLWRYLLYRQRRH